MEEQGATDWKTDLRRGAARLSAGLWAGILSGFVIGGIGSRLAMFVLRITSDPALDGAKTDDGFVIGEFTGDTGFLVLFATALGAMGGVAYLALRPWLPERWRGLLVAVFGGAVGGTNILHPDGIDFSVLEPLWLAIVMFIAIPTLGAFVIHVLAERFLERTRGRVAPSWVLAVLPLLGLLALGPLGPVVLVVATILWALIRRVPAEQIDNARGFLSRVVLTALASATAFFSFRLVQDVVAILA